MAAGKEVNGGGGDGDSGHHGWWCSGQNRAEKKDGFSSSLRSESIGTGITLTGCWTEQILGSEALVVFETSTGDYG
ncbi:hypothetical protein L484_002376 [Morus notabilis]|uniref:Uncharacterized protein n=1 Tax=Morus notabilis TaxID=981085 RepID=W9SMA3_9ROSA|nr:hypothetical protein L484_002376 [Morus notabilis]